MHMYILQPIFVAMSSSTPTSNTGTYTPVRQSAPVVTGKALLYLVYLATKLPFVGAKFWSDTGMYSLRTHTHKLKGVDATLLPLIPPSKAQRDTSQQAQLTLADLFRLADAHAVANPPDAANKPMAHWTVFDYYAAYKAGTTTPLRVAQAVLDAIHASDNPATENPALTAFLHTNKQATLAQAQDSTDRWAAGQPLSIFDGIPIAVKDELDVAQFPPAGLGTSFFAATRNLPSLAPFDSFCIGQLRAAGAVFVGKTTMSELGLDIINCNPITGTPRNPWNPAHHTGGSSGGSAASVASGLVPVAVGADGGGSVRIPASFCGVYGLKPTWGRISGGPTPSVDPSTGHIGPMATSIEGLAAAYALMSLQADPASLTADLAPPVALPKFLAYKSPRDLKGLRIGFYRDYFSDAETYVNEAVQGVLDYLVQHAGATVVDMTIPDIPQVRVAHVMSILSEVASLMHHQCPNEMGKLSYPTQVLMNLVQLATKTDYLTAQRQRTQTLAHLRNLFANQIDVMILPTTAMVAPKINPTSLSAGISDASFTLDGMRFAFLGNLTGLPALSCPVGFHEGLPIGCQIMGKWWDEDTVLTVGRAVSEYSASKKTRAMAAGEGDAEGKPKVWFDVLGEAVK
ncbi:amidase signature domain-containing protein, partial [Catenaria anguillulae PL171]